MVPTLQQTLQEEIDALLASGNPDWDKLTKLVSLTNELPDVAEAERAKRAADAREAREIADDARRVEAEAKAVKKEALEERVDDLCLALSQCDIRNMIALVPAGGETAEAKQMRLQQNKQLEQFHKAGINGDLNDPRMRRIFYDILSRPETEEAYRGMIDALPREDGCVNFSAQAPSSDFTMLVRRLARNAKVVAELSDNKGSEPHGLFEHAVKFLAAAKKTAPNHPLIAQAEGYLGQVAGIEQMAGLLGWSPLSAAEAGIAKFASKEGLEALRGEIKAIPGVDNMLTALCRGGQSWEP